MTPTDYLHRIWPPKLITVFLTGFLLLLAWSSLWLAMGFIWLPLLWLVHEGFGNIENIWARRGVKIMFGFLAIIPARYIGAPIFFTLHLSPCLTCNGHVAGYKWASDKIEYEETVSCSNPSKSFRRGCEIVVRGY